MNLKIARSEISNQQKEFENINKLVIVGKNGAGKSRLGYDIEKRNINFCHRISAQKSLRIPDEIPLKNYDIAEMEFLAGNKDAKRNFHAYKEGNRWGQQPTTGLLSDYHHVLTLLFVKENERNEKYKKRMDTVQLYEPAPESPIDIIMRIWRLVFPQRGIQLERATVSAILNGTLYQGREMSDGERCGLYLMAECLCVPQNYIIIIDEPELHLHRSIFSKLWDEIEKARPDCLFVYITHDLDFAAQRKNAKYLIVEKFDGVNWTYNTFDAPSEFPPAIIRDILGARKKILFVEGTGTSYDIELYSAIFPDVHIIPCGGCSEVIRCVKSKEHYALLNHVEIYGLIDRDFRPECEIEALEHDNIFTAALAEIENFFIVPELLILMIKRLGIVIPRDVTVKNEELIQRISEIYRGQLGHQIQKAVESEICFQLNKLIHDDFNNISTTVKEYIENSMPEIQETIHTRFNSAQGDYLRILALFNFKATMGHRDITNAITSLLGITRGSYEERVVTLLYDNDFRNDVVTAWRKYIPDELLSRVSTP